MKADSTKVNQLLKTARGQIDGIIRMVEEDRYCIDTSHQLLSCQAILQKANNEILKAHLETCVKEAFESGIQEESTKKIDELIELMNKMVK